MTDLDTKFLFTITTGRTGTTYLSKLLGENLPNAEVHHERIRYTTMGMDCPDASHMMQFNSIGKSEHVKKFWKIKSDRTIVNRPKLYAETSHFNVRAGLIESIENFTSKGKVKLLHLHRNKLDVVWSFYNRFDFANIGFSWLFSLDPDYPNVIVQSEEYLKYGMAGRAIWYVDEMSARAAYYQELVKDLRDVSFLSVSLDRLTEEKGARRVIEFFTGFSIANKIKMPNTQNTTEEWHFPIEKKQEIALIIDKLGGNPTELGKAFYLDGKRLSNPAKRIEDIKITIPVRQLKQSSLSPKKYISDSIDSLTAGDPKNAILQLSKGLLLHPNDLDMRKRLAQCLFDTGQLEKSLEQFEILLKNDPECKEHLSHKAVILLSMRRNDEAMRVGLEAAREDPLAWLSVASAYRNKKEDESALKALEKCVEILPKNILARNSINMLLYDMGNLEAAYEHGLEALKLKNIKNSADFSALKVKPILNDSPLKNNNLKNVIAFSLWGNLRTFVKGAFENLELAREHFPEWECRIYYDDSVAKETLLELERFGAILHLVSGELANLHGGFWRFAVANDRSVDKFLIRDLDGRLNERDAAAVNAWVENEYQFHIMRDHIYHTELILAGMWGGKAGLLPDLTKWANRFYGGHTSRWNDQYFLAKIVWPLIMKHSLIHDSIYYEKFMGEDFPSSVKRTKQNHIGKSFKLADKPRELGSFKINVKKKTAKQIN